MRFEPHSVAGSALKLASQLPLRGPAPSCAPHEGARPFRNPLPWVSNPTRTLCCIWSGRWDLNPRQLAWEARTLPLSYARSLDRILRWLRSQVNRQRSLGTQGNHHLRSHTHRSPLTNTCSPGHIKSAIPRPQIFFGQPSGGRFVPPQSRSPPSRRFASARQPLGLPE